MKVLKIKKSGDYMNAYLIYDYLNNIVDTVIEDAVEQTARHFNITIFDVVACIEQVESN